MSTFDPLRTLASAANLSQTDGGSSLIGRCQTCGRKLNVDTDPLSTDCGGDCWGCVGPLEVDGWPQSAAKVADEIGRGFRQPDGTAKPPV